MSFEIGRTLYPLTGQGVAHKDKRGPEVRVGIAVSQLLHRALKRQRAIWMLEKPAIEGVHEFRCALIVDVPQCQQQGPCPGIEQTPHQAHKLISGSNRVQSGGASAQGNLLDGQPEAVKVIEHQERIPQPDSGESWIVLAKNSVCGDMNQSALRPA